MEERRCQGRQASWFRFVMLVPMFVANAMVSVTWIETGATQQQLVQRFRVSSEAVVSLTNLFYILFPIGAFACSVLLSPNNKWCPVRLGVRDVTGLGLALLVLSGGGHC